MRRERGFRLPSDDPSSEDGLETKKSRGVAGFATLIETAFNRRIMVNNNGNRKRMMIFEIIVRRLIQRELAGDNKAAKVRMKFQTFSAAIHPKERKVIVHREYADMTPQVPDDADDDMDQAPENLDVD